jgi:hypothetical protein
MKAYTIHPQLTPQRNPKIQNTGELIAAIIFGSITTLLSVPPFAILGMARGFIFLIIGLSATLSAMIIFFVQRKFLNKIRQSLEH